MPATISARYDQLIQRDPAQVFANVLGNKLAPNERHDGPIHESVRELVHEFMHRANPKLMRQLETASGSRQADLLEHELTTYVLEHGRHWWSCMCSEDGVRAAMYGLGHARGSFTESP